MDRAEWILAAKDMLHCPPRAKGSDLAGARSDRTNAHGIAGGPRWRLRKRDRESGTTLASHNPRALRNWKVLLWVVVSLLPLVEGARIGPGDVVSGGARSVGLLVGGVEERQLPETLPEVVEEEKERVDGDPFSPWNALYDTHVTDEAGEHPGDRWAGRSPRSSDPSDAQPKGVPKKKKKRKKKEKERVVKEQGKGGSAGGGGAARGTGGGGEGDTEGRGGRRTGGRGGGREDGRGGGRSGGGGRGGGGRGRGGQDGPRGRQSPGQSSQDCHMEKMELKVRDLDQGYESDEIVLFKFCVGSCEPSRKNYDLALKHLLNGTLPRHTARQVASQPCCRPDRYESVSFMDTSTTWRTIEELSAASCVCMG